MARRRPKRRRGSGNKSLFFLFAFVFISFLGYLAWNSVSPGGSIPFLSSGTNTVKSKEVSKEENLTEKITKEIEKATTAITKNDKKGSEKSNSSAPDKLTPSTGEKKGVIPSGTKAKMAIVLDDFGMTYDIVEKYNAMGIPLTYAVLPNKAYSTEVAKAGAMAGQDIIVHLPMESESDVTPEELTIRTVMSDAEVRSATAKLLDSVPYAVGVNNHQGSKATSSNRVVGAVAKEVGKRGLFFLDSRTSSASVITSVARAQGVRSGANELFIDNSSDVEDIKDRLQEAANRAFQASDKSIIVIGHARPNTARAVGEMISSLQAQGIEFVLVRTLLY